MRVKIEVTQNDIKHGVRTKCERCPVAKAVSRKLKRGYKANVSGYSIDVKRGLETFVTVKTPKLAASFIFKFDVAKAGQRHRFTPFSFVVNIPKEYLDVG